MNSYVITLNNKELCLIIISNFISIISLLWKIQCYQFYRRLGNLAKAITLFILCNKIMLMHLCNARSTNEHFFITLFFLCYKRMFIHLCDARRTKTFFCYQISCPSIASRPLFLLGLCLEPTYAVSVIASFDWQLCNQFWFSFQLWLIEIAIQHLIFWSFFCENLLSISLLKNLCAPVLFK